MLGEWLLPLISRRRAPGVHDCATLPADWTVHCGLGDPMARWRGAYASEAEAKMLILEAGGLVNMFAEGALSIGIPVRTGEPLPGDVGVLSVHGEEAGSIFTGQRWVFVGERGLGFATIDPGHVSQVWAVGHG